ncbi:cytochrome c oxidase assembly factor Coa1 family protein [Marilutibacter chinensis]|uniref:Cytochrome c oxidase assembly factor 1 family protein n=1 Tax=Marilutibacter chinensis TaxID=2912247 RepID=A0ABS9HYC3_9GAMM|nr:cytochrome c oxidase assembly factor Coa1 family protein [Lysobacter chinensis]MCF7223813.1 cytochrome c oxidase assembly factor 1 family protein [Lysobacter chinensis]
MTRYTESRDSGHRNWWQRNWKWVVPLGGIAMLALFAAAIFGFVSLLSGMMRSSEPYRHALAETRASAEVVAALGEPIEPGFMPTGNINISNDEGKADLAIGVEGPKGEATVYVEATRKRKRWSYRTLVVALADREIDLLAGDAGGGRPDDGDEGSAEDDVDAAAAAPRDTAIRKSGAAKPLDGD